MFVLYNHRDLTLQFLFISLSWDEVNNISVMSRQFVNTLQRRYNAVAYNAETVITRLGLGSRFFPHQFESVALFPRNAAV